MVKQVLPLPQGVSDYAVGGAASGRRYSSAKSSALISARPAPPASYIGAPRSLPEEAEADFTVPAIQIDKIIVTRTLDKKVVNKIVEDELNRLETCYINALSRNPGLKGDLVIKLSIGAHGSVNKAELVTSAADRKALGECMIRKIKAWKFDLPADAKAAAITITLKLIPQ